MKQNQRVKQRGRFSGSPLTVQWATYRPAVHPGSCVTLVDIIADSVAGIQYKVIQETFTDIFHNLYIDSMLIHCWASLKDAGQTVKQHDLVPGNIRLCEKL